MKDEIKAWIYSFLLALLCVFCFAAVYWLIYKNPALYDAFLRVLGGSGEMYPPKQAMMRLAVGIIPCTLFIRVVLWVPCVSEKNESEGAE